MLVRCARFTKAITKTTAPMLRFWRACCALTRSCSRPFITAMQRCKADIAVLRARDTLVGARTSCINAVRRLVKSQGARLPQCSTESFVRRVAAYVPSALEVAIAPLLETIAALTTQIRAYEHRIADLARERYPQTALLTQVTGVGPLTSLGFILTLGHQERFTRSRDVGPYLGLVPRQYDSGNQQSQLRITKAGNPYLRRLLVNSAQYILGRREKCKEASGGSGCSQTGHPTSPLVVDRCGVRSLLRYRSKTKRSINTPFLVP
jgi:transposase